jgi:hypothetical protein
LGLLPFRQQPTGGETTRADAVLVRFPVRTTAATTTLSKDVSLTHLDATARARDLTIGDVSVWALGNDRFRIESPADEEEVVGFEEAERRADELAGRV